MIFFSNRNDYYYLVSAHDSKYLLSLSYKIFKNNTKILCLFPNGKKKQLFKFIKVSD